MCILGWSLKGARKQAFTHPVWNCSTHAPSVTSSVHSTESSWENVLFSMYLVYILISLKNFPNNLLICSSPIPVLPRPVPVTQQIGVLFLFLSPGCGEPNERTMEWHQRDQGS